MRRYELPMDEFLTKLKNVLTLNNISTLWVCEEFNGLNMTYMPGFFCDSTVEAAINVRDFLAEYSMTKKLNIPCCVVADELKSALSQIYREGKFYSNLNDVSSYGKCSGIKLQDNQFLSGFRSRLEKLGIEHVWVQGMFNGEKLPGMMYHLDTYTFPWSLCEYVDPYADNDEVYSDVRSYCMATNHLVPEDLNLIYDNGVFYEGR